MMASLPKYLIAWLSLQIFETADLLRPENVAVGKT